MAIACTMIVKQSMLGILVFSVLIKYVILNIFIHPRAPASIGTATCGMAIIS